MLIPLKDIFVFPDRQRTSMDAEELAKLAASIKENGLLQNIVVRKKRPEDLTRNGGVPFDEPYVLVAGGRRTAAHVLLQRYDIEAKLFEDLPPLQQERAELEENLQRQGLTWQEEIRARERIDQLIKELGGGGATQGQRLAEGQKTAKERAQEQGVSQAQLSRDRTLLTLMAHDPEIKAAPTKRAAMRLAEHKINMASRIGALSDVSEEDLKKKLHTADARGFIKTLPDKSVNLIFTDLPYGIDYKSATDIGGGGQVMGKYDDGTEGVRDFVTDLVPQMCRVLKPNGWMVLFFAIEGMHWLSRCVEDACAEHGIHKDPMYPNSEHCEAGPGCRWLKPSPLPWVWYRPNSRGIPQWPDRYAKHMYEMMLVVNGGEARMVVHNQPDVLVHDSVYENRLHEMQKPMALCQDVIRRLTLEGELVADFCFGSGAHLAAAASLSRDFIGCDNNPDNLASAVSLVSQHYKK